MMYSFPELTAIFENALENYSLPNRPRRLYEPVEYILSLGGKRIRPKLVLAAYNLFKDKVDYALNAAFAVEYFHNFSLLHDDIMDNAYTRRGKDTVHVKYDSNSAILSGDVMLIWMYKFLEDYEAANELSKLATRTSIEVCEGQRMDIDFETSSEVTINQYIEMITLKTSVLLGCAMQMGGILANASESDKDHLYQFGKNVGIAFQIQDDLLDTFGTESLIGKKVGGDILQKKKTYLYLKSLELLSPTQAKRLKDLYLGQQENADAEQIKEVKNLFRAAHVNVHCEELKLVYQQLAMSHLEALSVSYDRKQILKAFANKILDRQS